MIEEFFVILFVMAVLASGLWCVIDPQAVVRFRTRIGWSTSLWSGGFAYSTAGRARFTGSLLVAIAVFVIAVGFFGR
jgi:hypothetical protein